MTQKAEDLIASIAEFFAPSSKRYAESLAPLMPKRPVASNSVSAPRRVSVFGTAA